jgi:hypothetical protein
MLDAAVLAGAVASLEHHEDAVHLGAEHRILQLEKLLPQRGEARLGLLAGHALGGLRGQVVEADLPAGLVENALGHRSSPAPARQAERLATRPT